MDLVSRSQTSAFNEKSLANLKPWKPGQSGNPSGRPARKPITDLCEEIINHPETRERIKQQVIQTLTSKGMAGVLLLREIGERVEGKVTQGIELSGTISTMTDEQVDERLTKLLDLDLKQHENSVINIPAQSTRDSTHEPERDTIPAK